MRVFAAVSSRFCAAFERHRDLRTVSPALADCERKGLIAQFRGSGDQAKGPFKLNIAFKADRPAPANCAAQFGEHDTRRLIGRVGLMA